MRYSADQVASRAEQVRVDGFTVLEEVLAPDVVAGLSSEFSVLLGRHAAVHPVNRGPNRFQMYLPWEPPFADPLLYENEHALAVIDAVLGPDAALVYFASDTALPGSDYQRVHADTRLLFPEARLSLPAYGVVLNVPLVDCTEENGSLEFWPGGTHLTSGPVDLEKLAPQMLSRRANLKAGSMLIRDLRMWHRGTPNHSSAARPHLALVYTRPWYRFEQEVPAITAAAFEKLSERGRLLLRHARIAG